MEDASGKILHDPLCLLALAHGVRFFYLSDERINAERRDALPDQRQGQIVQLAEAHTRLANVVSLAHGPIGSLERLAVSSSA